MNSNTKPLPSSRTREQLSNTSENLYVGRFAPSPTGGLHFGSLVSALASYLDAKHNNGQWLLRIEDLDPPREEPGAISKIIQCLEAHHLYWDGDILYQSQRLAAYTETLEQLRTQSLVYPCYCTRKQLAKEPGPYPGTCRNITNLHKPSSTRLLTSSLPQVHQHVHFNLSFDDLILGDTQCENTLGDFIIRRKDGLFSYQLAVVIDDAYQGITHIIRGADLLDCTPAQQFLFQLLNKPTPQFGHVPVALNDQGQKLSKQHGAQTLDNKQSRDNLRSALTFLNHQPSAEFIDANEDELLHWAVQHWDRTKVPAFHPL